ncbi:tumor necrosis factor alpha-induced protein 3-like [Dendronephthya gigantea]|uniref:tumor necrosis factor alpha-induced protein 3-like n=1 Tax=Dendronephthya gigantea TaxID=151771 RepID=UPI00106CF5E2|nr:tumor necrosis factor alpha-induced protein 3-like [Dendronephthya gigantea]XP_028414020.1 tumor necrosis factor alpha-induced protein 3-like [Dendronephthya gigantea]
MDNPRLERTMSLTDVNTSSAIRDRIERDITVPADRRPRFFLELPRHDFILPSLTRFDQDFRKFLLSVLVDFNVMQELEEAKCVNWCKMLPKFLPLQTLGDGNCLMHAVSQCMWAVQDRRLTLRKSVYQALIEDQTDMLRKRWQFEEEQRLEKQNGSPVDCSNEQWDEDWRKTVELASTNSLNALGEIHIFVLANLLRRPILVLCDDILRGNYDESLSDVNLGGIYLPLLCDSVDCVKSPVVIGYHQGHFMALVMTEDGSATGEDMFRMNKNAVPLVKYNGEPMQLHFVLPDELQSSDRLLREYLNCSKVDYTENEATRTILVATMQSQEPEVHLHRMFKTYFGALQAVYMKKLTERQISSGQNYRSPSPGSPSCSEQFHDRRTEVVAQNNTRCCSAHKRCKNSVCTFYTSRTNDYCHRCRKSEPQLCTSPGCTFAGSPDYEGLCSSCFARYRALLEEEAPVMATPSAPPSNKCCNSNCPNDAGEYFGGKCHECYSNYIHNPNLQDWAATTSSQSSEPRAMERRVKQAENSLSVVGQPSPALPRQSSRLFCFNRMCNNPLEQSDDIYCKACSSSHIEDSREINTVFKVCHVSGCNMPSVTYHRELCFKHFKEYESRTQSKPDQKHGKGKCINKNCQFYGIPENNYLCSQCHAKALQEEYDRQRIKAEQDRSQAQWLAQTASSEQHQLEPLRKPFYFEAISSPNQSCSAPPSPRKGKRAQDLVPCPTKGCPRFGTKDNQGLCNICFQKKEKLLYYKETSSVGRNRHSSLP